MKVTKPWFYDKFVCTADKCTDNCCIGWEIDIDDVSIERFKNAEGEFGERLRSAIHTEGGCPAFALCEGERCALLREDGLCELILNMGENSLCDICALHPRFFGWYNERKNAGIGLCCEEVCRLLFSDKEPLRFVEEEIDEPYEDEFPSDAVSRFWSFQNALIQLLQDRKTDFGKRLNSFADVSMKLQGRLDGICQGGVSAEAFDIGDLLDELFKLYGECESVNSEWEEALKALIDSKAEICAELPTFLSESRDEIWRYEHIAVYTCFRYVMSGIYETDLLSKAYMVCFMVLGSVLLDCLTYIKKGKVSEWDRIINLKLLSKQFEYSEENLQLIFDEAYGNTLISIENLADCFAND